MGIKRLLGLQNREAIKESIHDAEKSAAELGRTRQRQLDIAKRLRLLQAEIDSYRREH
jgi:hypothetical protein